MTQIDDLIARAGDPNTTPFDYIIVGSGAGGGPLAARLAIEGMRVLVIEAGLDPALPNAKKSGPLEPPKNPDPDIDGDRRRINNDAFEREVYRVPGYHPAASEDEKISWEYSVRHYTSGELQERDTKYAPDRDPWPPGKPDAQGGIDYPRCSALGGCTAHHAMVVIKPPAGDWDRIAKLTGDDTWRADGMNDYFTRIEKCLYYSQWHGFFRKFFGWTYLLWRRFIEFLNPRWILESGGHGFKGWQKTSFTDPLLVVRIAIRDFTFLRVLARVFFELLRQGGVGKLLKRVVVSQWLKFLDPNLDTPRATEYPSLSFIPIGTDGRRRVGVREHLRETAARYPDRLVLLIGTHVARVIFDDRLQDGAPRAIGVEACRGAHLYDASPLFDAEAAEKAPKEHFFASREIILCGGTFNTPQLLMLSGIGDAAQLGLRNISGPRNRAGEKVAEVVDLPSVGRNLQDRNEISVISETKKEFRTLRGVSFRVGDTEDRAIIQWRKTGRGLYSTNGGALAIFVSTSERQYRDEPDLMVVGFPVAFRGYYRGWSKGLLRKHLHDADDNRRLWSWVILQGHTRNRSGSVELRSSSPFEQPNVNFRYFDESREDTNKDLALLLKGIHWVRKLNGKIGALESEVEPGPERGDYSRELEHWVKYQAWGHHACGTCRMGAERWQAKTAGVRDAVVASDFRVHGVAGLRVVDASVFPEIPGYFIVTSVFMISEKAADVLLEDRAEYPRRLRAAEAVAVQRRRDLALGHEQPVANPPDAQLPADAVGLALSGGGIRSATFSLGIVQALARRDRLRGIDFLSTVSGGGYIGAFLGRLFMRGKDAPPDELASVAGQVQNILARPDSPEIWWLRSHANYISGEGRAESASNVGTIWRNLLTQHACIGTLGIAAFAGLRLIADTALERFDHTTLFGVRLSPWWWLPLLLAAFALFPIAAGYWLAPPRASRLDHPRASIPVWLFALAVAISAAGVPPLRPYAPVAVVLLLLAWFAQETARSGIATAPAELRGDIARNRLTRGAGAVLRMLAILIGWVAIDTCARRAALTGMLPLTSGGAFTVASALPLLREVARKLLMADAGPPFAIRSWMRRLATGGLSFVLLGFLLFALDLLVHAAFEHGETLGIWLLLSALGLSLAMGQAIEFPNSFSLHALYAARLSRTFLGAANENRVSARAAEANAEVQTADAGDDLPFERYNPQRYGGPLHLINACVNETVDVASARPLRQDKGLSMCVGPSGVSVGKRFHALWQPDVDPRTPPAQRRERAGLSAVTSDPGSFHVLAQRSGDPARVEPLMLSQWISTSGAAVGTGLGRYTTLPTALLLGIFNIRLGYWWNSGIDGGARPGRYPPALLRRLKGSLGRIFRAQATILNEWRGYFTGPSERFWYLSDGGHFEDTGGYELLRRRIPLMICANGTEDPGYDFEAIAVLMRRARLDFGAEITWLDRIETLSAGDGWDALDPKSEVPHWVRSWLDPRGIGSVWKIGRGGPQSSALARVDYGDGTVCWLLLINTGPLGEMPLDLRSYAAIHQTFPQDSTVDQFFTDDQWESYRELGELAASAVIRKAELRP